MRRVKLAVYLTLLISWAACASGNDPEIKIDQGVLKGRLRQTWNGRTMSSFTGIPYAEPPVGELRFKSPVPAKPWQGTLDATKPHAMCPQINIYLNDFEVKGDEDCLYLNVYTPQLPSTNLELLPVMFYIHGGGWMCGDANDGLYGPEILLDKDIILVTINYRLGALGFLSTGDKVLPGNNGLKDQNLALKWVKNNIVHFGGDPEKITVFGQSAGGASSHYHVLSPLSKDLIHGAILQSGTALAPWAFGSKELAAQNTKKLANFLNCPTTSSQAIVDCLKSAEAYDIVNQDVKFLEWSYHPMIPFKPVAEPAIEGAFLTKEPLDIIKHGESAEVPIMTGFTAEDAAMQTASLFNNTKLIAELDKDFNRIAPFTLLYDQTLKDKDAISKRIRKFYLGDRQIDETMKDELTKMFTDAWFLLAEDATVRAHFKFTKKPVYYYLFDYRGTMSFTSIFGDATRDYGVCHCDDLIYLFSNSLLFKDYKPNESDKKMNDVMTTLWTNFATTGNPTPETDSTIRTKWEPVKSDKQEYYHIKNENNLKMKKELNLERALFWRTVPFAPRWKKFRDEL